MAFPIIISNVWLGTHVLMHSQPRDIGMAQCKSEPALVQQKHQEDVGKEASCHLWKEQTAARAQLRTDNHQHAQFLHSHPFLS